MEFSEFPSNRKSRILPRGVFLEICDGLCTKFIDTHSPTVLYPIPTMASLIRTAFSTTRTFARPCVASTSRLTRTYATESTVTASEIYGTSKGPEGAIMKKYTGKGFPAIPVSHNVENKKMS